MAPNALHLVMIKSGGDHDEIWVHLHCMSDGKPHEEGEDKMTKGTVL